MSVRNLKYRQLGNTGLLVSEVAFGCIPILKGEVSILPHYYGLSEKEALSVMDKAYEQGCNLYDTAIVPEYGDAEIKLGKFKKQHPDIYISDKARAYTKSAMEIAINTSLRNLGCDKIDIYFVHQVAPENEDVVFNEGALDVLVKYKNLGYINCVGIATHHYNIAYRAALDKRVDVIQVPGNVLERGIIDRIEAEAAFKNVGLLVCKVFAGGVLPEYYSPASLIDFVLSYPIDCAIIGMGSIGHVVASTNNIGTHPDRMELKKVIEKFDMIYDIIPCTRCQKCTCSIGIEVESIFRFYNYYNLGHRHWAHERLMGQDPSFFERCLQCAEQVCLNKCNICITIGNYQNIKQR